MEKTIYCDRCHCRTLLDEMRYHERSDGRLIFVCPECRDQLEHLKVAAERYANT